MERFVTPPKPTEETLTEIVSRDVPFPNGRTLRLAMSAWHWQMIEFLELWNEHYNREHGILYEFYNALPNVTDQRFSKSLMLLLRDDYNEWLANAADGEPKFPDPRR